MTVETTLETGWTRSLRRGETPDHASLRDHLRAVHSRHAGFTESCALRCRDGAGRTSYQWLADIVDPARHRDVLDLACGSGVLLELCHRRHRPPAALVGIDMSAEELALARRRIPDPAVTLHQGLAQDLDFLADASIDAVLCHWALTLMDPVAPVLHEASRVLRPGGVFAAIVDGDMASAPGYADVHHLIYDRVQREYPRYGTVELGDPRVRDSAALAALAATVFRDAEVRIEPAVLTLDGPPGILAGEAAGFFYASFVLSEAGRRRMLEALTALFAAGAADGIARFAMPINRLVVRQA